MGILRVVIQLPGWRCDCSLYTGRLQPWWCRNWCCTPVFCKFLPHSDRKGGSWQLSPATSI